MLWSGRLPVYGSTSSGVTVFLRDTLKFPDPFPRSPGYTLTKLTKNLLSENKELKKYWEKLTPMARMGKPEDLDVNFHFTMVSWPSSLTFNGMLRAQSCSCRAKLRSTAQVLSSASMADTA